MPQWIAEHPDRPGVKYEIRSDKPEVGFYLYVWQDGRCVKDHLQDTLQAAMDQAAQDYRVNSELWREISN